MSERKPLPRGVHTEKDAEGLTATQRAFVDLYVGNPTAAARGAGYTSKDARIAGQKLLMNPTVQRALANRHKREVRRGVLSRIERQEFWSETILNEKVPMQFRLKASELLGRSEGDFVDRVDVTSKGKSLGELVLKSVEEAKERRANETAIEAEVVETKRLE